MAFQARLTLGRVAIQARLVQNTAHEQDWPLWPEALDDT